MDGNLFCAWKKKNTFMRSKCYLEKLYFIKKKKSIFRINSLNVVTSFGILSSFLLTWKWAYYRKWALWIHVPYFLLWIGRWDFSIESTNISRPCMICQVLWLIQGRVPHPQHYCKFEQGFLCPMHYGTLSIIHGFRPLGAPSTPPFSYGSQKCWLALLHVLWGQTCLQRWPLT